MADKQLYASNALRYLWESVARPGAIASATSARAAKELGARRAGDARHRERRGAGCSRCSTAPGDATPRPCSNRPATSSSPARTWGGTTRSTRSSGPGCRRMRPAKHGPVHDVGRVRGSSEGGGGPRRGGDGGRADVAGSRRRGRVGSSLWWAGPVRARWISLLVGRLTRVKRARAPQGTSSASSGASAESKRAAQLARDHPGPGPGQRVPARQLHRDAGRQAGRDARRRAGRVARPREAEPRSWA